MTKISHRKKLILRSELAFANAVGAAVIDKPRVSFWMILVPILFLYFIYRMQKYKSGLRRFEDEFMTTRRWAMDLACESIDMNRCPDIGSVIKRAGLNDTLENDYARWVRALVAHYMNLLSAEGDNFESLVRSAHHDRTNYLQVLNYVSRTENEFYAALKPQLNKVEGAVEIIAAIESMSRQLRRDIAEHVFS